jgi:PAS domain S-box-containing protein
MIVEQTQTLLDLVQEGTHLGFWTCDLINGTNYWDARCREIFGVSFDEPVSVELGITLIHPEDRSRAQEVFTRALDPSTPGQYKIEKRILRRDGTVRWVMTRGRAIFEREGAERRAVLLTGIVKDITEEKQTEEQLAFQATILAQIQDAVVVVDNEECIIYLNAAASRQYDIQIEQAKGRRLSELYRYIWLSPEEEVQARTALAESGYWQGENLHVKHNGEAIHVSSTVSQLKDEAGHPIGMAAVIRDISAQKETEAALRRERELWGKIFELNPLLLTMFDPSTSVLRLNRAFEKTFGWTTEEVAHIDLMEHVYPDPVYREEVAAYMQAARQGWREFNVTTRTGQIVPSLWTNIRLSDDTLVGVGIDLTERRQAEREREQLMERITDSFFSLDSEWRFTYVNQAAEASFRRSRTEMLGNNIWEVFPEAVGTPYDHYYRQAMESQQTVKFVAHYPPYEIWTEAQVYPSPEGLSVFFQDVTERQRLTQEREEAYALLDSLFEAVPLGLGFWDRDLRYRRVNQALSIINGLSPERHIGKRPSDLLPDLDDVHDLEGLWRQVLVDGKAQLNIEVRGSTPATTEPRIWRGHFYPVTMGQETIGIGGLVEDITTLKQAEVEREQLLATLAQERAQLADLAQTLDRRVQERTRQVQTLSTKLALAEQQERDRVAHILHDHVQQMLYGIQWRIYAFSLDLIQAQPEVIDGHLGEIKQLLGAAIDAARSLSVELSPRVLKNEGLPEAIAWLGAQMKDRHALEVIIKHQGDCQIADPGRRILLFQMVRELLFNVVKHAQVNHVSVDLCREAEAILIRVRDEGRGFSLAELSDEDTIQTGFGLPSIRERLGLFDGRLEIQSAPGQGTEITLLLPL